MRNFILTLTLLVSILNFSHISAQNEPCATAALMNKLLVDFPETRERLELFDQVIKESTQNKNQNRNATAIPPPNSITIPVVVYIVHDGTTLTNISDSQVNDQLIALNTYYLSTGIKFCLATKVNGTASIPIVNTSDVQATPGIIHVNNSTLSNHFSTQQSNLVATASPQITKDRYLRIWVVKSIDGVSSGTLGYSMFPNTSPIFDGVVMRYDVFGNGNPNMLANYNLGKVLAHEVGHYLFLYHTFEGSCNTSLNDCLLDGDHVCDTPRVAAPNFNCVTGTNSCVETPAILDDLSNYMDYGNNQCQNHFTNGQIERMLAVLNLNRSTLFSTDNIIYTGTCGFNNLLSATIAPSDFSPCVSSTIATTFTAPSALTYSWNFGDSFSTGSNPNTASTQTASHIFTSAANSPYTVTLTVTNSNGDSRISSEQIFVTNCSPILSANSYWYLDSSNGLDFRTGVPVFDPTFPTNHFANLVCNSQCDANGNLVFYVNGQKVYNKQHMQINTSNLMLQANGDSSNKMLIVPKPPLTGGSISQYYIFMNQCSGQGTLDQGFRYNMVNVTGTNATMGATNQPVTLPSSYGFDLATDGSLLGASALTAVKKCNSNEYWILTILNKGTTRFFVVFSLTSSGLVYQSERQIGTDSIISYSIKMAPNGNKLVINYNFGFSNNPSSRIYDFNKAEGIVSTTFSVIALPRFLDNLIYGNIMCSSFSPDSRLLYVSNYFDKKIYQFNLDAINVNNTQKEIVTTSVGPWGMQLGPDNKLYVGMANSTNNYQKLSVIHNPNIIATTQNPNACNFSINGPKPIGFSSRVGPELPNNIDAKQETAYFAPNTPNVVCKYITGCNTYKFFPNVCGTSFIWRFTNTTLGTSFTTTVTNPTYNFSQNGTYIVTVKSSANVLLGTSSPIVITSATSPVITGSTTACLTRANESITNNSVVLNAGESVTWSITGGSGNITGSVNNQPSVNINWTSLPGTITLTKVSATGCTSVTTKTITSFCAPLNTQDIIVNGLTISPNPSHGMFTIHSENNLGRVSITVFDLRGRIVSSQKNFDFNSNEKTIDLSGCQSGMYMLIIIGSDFSYSHKLIKN